MHRLLLLIVGSLLVAASSVACFGKVAEDASAAPLPDTPVAPAPACSATATTAAVIELYRLDAGTNYPNQLTASNGHVLLGTQTDVPEVGALLDLKFDAGSATKLATDYREDYTLTANGQYLVYFAATGPAPVIVNDAGTSYEMAPGAWVARDLVSGEVRPLGKESDGFGVALRDGSVAVVTVGEDGKGPAEIWSWNPATDQIMELPTASFTDGRAPIIVTNGVDLFVEDDGTDDHPTFRLWKVDLAAKRATMIHEEPPRGPSDLLFLGADSDTLYLLDESPPTLRTFTRQGAESATIALDLEDGQPSNNGLAPLVIGGMTDGLLYLTSTSGQTMYQLDPHSGIVRAQTPAPTKYGIWAYATDPCYLYFSSDETVMRVPRAY